MVGVAVVVAVGVGVAVVVVVVVAVGVGVGVWVAVVVGVVVVVAVGVVMTIYLAGCWVSACITLAMLARVHSRAGGSEPVAWFHVLFWLVFSAMWPIWGGMLLRDGLLHVRAAFVERWKARKLRA